jgi:protein archease
MDSSDCRSKKPASHRPLEHTADLGVELDAPSLDALFAEAAVALGDTLTPVAGVGSDLARELRVESSDTELLLVDFLNELLFLFETEGLIVASAQVQVECGAGTAGVARLRAHVRGERYDETKHPLRSLVKAVTYHGLRVWRDGDRFRAQVLFDL